MKHLIPWFGLKSVPGIGNHLYKKLIDHFTSPDRVLGASAESLCRIPGVTEKLARAVGQHKIDDKIPAYIESVFSKGYRIMTYTDEGFPPLLREIPDPPPYLHVFGKPEDAFAHIAVVGSRNATDYGLSVTRRLCEGLAARGITVVSGMARGIDTAAHIGALAGGGKTIAVLGSGFDQVYPAANQTLFKKISQNGGVFSEFELDAEPQPHHFPLRNRIISGVSLGVVVVEAAGKSGSLITARLAAEQNREVFAVPGSIHSQKSAGAHGLIKKGAKLVENIEDILEEFPYLLNTGGVQKQKEMDRLKGTLSREEYQVVSQMGPYPVHIDDLMRKTSIAPGKLSGILLHLELLGLVVQMPGKLFCLSAEGGC
jgi:DNA processing protein